MKHRLCGFSGCQRIYSAVRVYIAGHRMSFCCANHALQWLSQFDMNPPVLTLGARVMRRNGAPEFLTGTVVTPRTDKGEVQVRWDGDEITTYLLRPNQLLLMPPEKPDE